MGEPGDGKPVGIHKPAADRIAFALGIYFAAFVIGALIVMIALFHKTIQSAIQIRAVAR